MNFRDDIPVKEKYLFVADENIYNKSLILYTLNSKGKVISEREYSTYDLLINNVPHVWNINDIIIQNLLPDITDEEFEYEYNNYDDERDYE